MRTECPVMADMTEGMTLERAVEIVLEREEGWTAVEEQLHSRLKDRGDCSKDLLMRSYRALSICCEERGDFEGSLSSFEKYMKMRMEIRRESKEELLDELEQQHQLHKKEQEAEISRLKNVELTELNRKLREAHDQIDVLSDLLPICAGCKKIRNDSGYWESLEKYMEEHSGAHTVNSLCPECSEGSFENRPDPED